MIKTTLLQGQSPLNRFVTRRVTVKILAGILTVTLPTLSLNKRDTPDTVSSVVY